ncbi:Sulfite exporter TauE/SafE [Pseudomonas saudimassiliensis]|uniref:Probable membrane transporter protein n=1 Tax=Pseudomonas saudimassiliensis TaxID=1461581 RepID=A0A078M3S8_9PSED|nr:TSUP family transporter [Pseudomonas saudimassiliensis]CEA00899.1 Sulfite exporter TauE/SafE [Pseudomonas saudimassiliensis]CEF25317.1 Sulfite exporter TauE/SafE [Pseudomonas saudimassiliensis]
MIDPWIWIGLFVLIAYTIEAITGFGSLVIALSLGALLLPVPELLPVLVPLNVLMSGFLAWRNRQHLDRALLLKVILPLMLGGTLVGYLLQNGLADQVLKLLLGLLIIWFACRELWRLRCSTPARAHPAWLNRLLILAAGISHGLFASGGPLLVYAMAGTALDKFRLRATLLCVWFTLNTSLSVLLLVQDRLASARPQLLWFLPLLVVGVVVGEYLHPRVNEQRFRQTVYALLAVTGVLLAVQSV